MSDGRFFSTTKKGEVAEYKDDLHASDRKRQKNAVKRVIAAMTVGKDVSSLFPDVVNCMQTEDMELKKLVYLYLINYAKTQPDLAIMAVNTFVKDSQDPNPLVRALAIRTMGCIRVDKIVEYLCDPLAKGLRDADPYVRKTAAVCVAKLHDIAPDLAAERGFLDALAALVGDANPMVVANAVASLREVGRARGEAGLRLSPATLATLLRALNECTEWGQVFIMDALAAGPPPPDAAAAEELLERVEPRLAHANGAVVVAAARLALRAAEKLDEEATKIDQSLAGPNGGGGGGGAGAGSAGASAEASALRASASAHRARLAPPLVSLLGGPPESQYVALRCISLIAAKHPDAFRPHVRAFFVRYTDPGYVKLEKLDAIVALASPQSLGQILLELREYAAEVDVEFVRRAVRAVGAVAVAVEEGADQAVGVLLELVRGGTPYVVQEAVSVARDVFRRYPNRYESLIAALCDNLDGLDEPEAKAAMAWILGEYSHRIDGAEDVAERFLESFPEEPLTVQLALVTAVVKLFLRAPTDKARALLQLVLTYATQESDSPDLRDRAFVYWRMLSADPDAARDVVLAPRPPIDTLEETIDPALRDALLAELGSLASVYRKPPEAFVAASRRVAAPKLEDIEAGRAAAAAAAAAAEAAAPAPAPPAASPPPPPPPPPQVDLLGDLLDVEPAAPPAPAPASPAPVAGPPLPQGHGWIVPPSPGRTVAVSGRLARAGEDAALDLAVFNASASTPLPAPLLQINVNAWGLTPQAQALPLSGPVPPKGVGAALARLRADAGRAAPPPAAPARPTLQLAFKTAEGVLYGEMDATVAALLRPDGRVPDEAFVGAWRAAPGAGLALQALPAGGASGAAPGAAPEAAAPLRAPADPAALAAKLTAANVFVLATKRAGDEAVLYASGAADAPPGRAAGPTRFLLELRFVPGGAGGIKVTYKTPDGDLALGRFVLDALAAIVAQQ